MDISCKVLILKYLRKRLMIPKIIKTEKDYDWLLDRINDLMDADPGTSEGETLDLLVTLVELYEKGKHPIDLPDAVRALRSRGRG
jgi:HTH-type transcriptional regulator/antitoxin HigA